MAPECADIPDFFAQCGIAVSRGAASLILDTRHAGEAKIGHGGVAMTLAEAAAFSLLPTRDWVLISMQTHLISAAWSGDLMTAKSRIVRQTRSVLFADIEVVCDERVVLRAMALFEAPIP